MKPRGAKTYPDFNPALRHPADFGYSSFKDAVHSVFQAFGLTAPLAYPRALDTSHWTCENIQDWQAVAQTIVLQYNKSTEGYSFQDVDSQLATLEGKTAGLISIFYHFFRRNLNGTSQWNYFKSKTENLILQIGGAKIVIIDMETADGVPNSTGNLNFKLFCNSAHADGYKVGLYVNPAQWVSFGLGSWVNEFVDFYIIAHWQAGNNPDQPAGIDPAKIAMQQEGVLGLHSWIQPIPGLIPQMDANLLLWPLAQWETFTGQKYTPGGIEPPPPEPEPIGEPSMQFTNPTSKLEIRSSPNKIITPSNDVGDLPKDSVIIALEVRATDSNSVWVRFAPKPEWITKAVPEYWCAMVHDGQGPLLAFVTPPPIAYLVKTAIGNTPLYYWKEKNVSGKPIMVKPTDPPKFLAGKQVIVDPVEVDTDGTENYYRVLNGPLATPPALTPPAPWQGWYVKVSEVF